MTIMIVIIHPRTYCTAPLAQNLTNDNKGGGREEGGSKIAELNMRLLE